MTECWRGEGAQYRNVITHYCQNNINIIIVLSGVKFLTFALPTIHIVINISGPRNMPRYRPIHVNLMKLSVRNKIDIVISLEIMIQILYQLSIFGVTSFSIYKYVYKKDQ